LDLWARDHYKSTIITYGGVIQEVLRARPMTRTFLRFSSRARPRAGIMYSHPLRGGVSPV